MISAVARNRHPALIVLFTIFTESARGYMWFACAVLLNLLIWFNIHLFEDQLVILKAMLSPLLAWGIGKILKKIFKRKRPVQAIDGFEAQTHSPMDDSFPSLHAASSFSFALTMMLIQFPHAWLFLVWSAMVILSRFYLGVHYLTDLFGGILVGLISAIIMTSILAY